MSLSNKIIDIGVNLLIDVLPAPITARLTFSDERPYWLVAVDRNATSSSHELSAIKNKIDEGSAMLFEDFIQITPCS